MIKRLADLWSRFTLPEKIALALVGFGFPLLLATHVIGVIAGQLRGAYALLIPYAIVALAACAVAVVQRVRLYRAFQEEQARLNAGNSIIGYDEFTAGWGQLEESSAPELSLMSRVLRSNYRRRMLWWGLRTKAPFSLDATAHQASWKRFDFDGLCRIGELAQSDPTIAKLVLPSVDASALIDLARLASDIGITDERLDHLLTLADQYSSRASDPEALVLARLLLMRGRRDEARALILANGERTWSRQLLVADLLNPLAYPDQATEHALEGWLMVINEPFRTSGLESITVNENLPHEWDPFDRIEVAGVLPTLSDGPLVSVIMSAFEPDQATLTSVKSIVHQTYANWELLVMDDASGPEFDEMFERIESLDPRVRVVRSTVNGGTYVRRNEALNLASGELVTMQDSDDWSHPRRLELQVKHLDAHPKKMANTVHSVRVSREMLFVQPRGVHLRLSEPGIMFRKDPVVSKIGYFDSVRRSADTEFRLRLESVFGEVVEPLQTTAPLMLMRFDYSSLSGSDFTDGWTHPARFAYRSAQRAWREGERRKKRAPYMPFPLETRPFPAPEHLGGPPRTLDSPDVLVVMDARDGVSSLGFAKAVRREIVHAVESDLTVGFMQVNAMPRSAGKPELLPFVQEWINDGLVHEFHVGEPLTVKKVVARHASALMGLPLVEHPVVSAMEVVVVEDRVHGLDTLGLNFTRGWVESQCHSYFGVAPSWEPAAKDPIGARKPGMSASQPSRKHSEVGEEVPQP